MDKTKLKTAVRLANLTDNAKITIVDTTFTGEADVRHVRHFAEVFTKLSKGGRPPIDNPKPASIRQRKWRAKQKDKENE